jgi:hypothetical protein
MDRERVVCCHFWGMPGGGAGGCLGNRCDFDWIGFEISCCRKVYNTFFDDEVWDSDKSYIVAYI